VKSVKYLLPIGVLIALVWIVAARSQPQDQFTDLTPIPSASASSTPEGTPKPGVHANDGVLDDNQWIQIIQSPDQYIGSKVDLTGRIFNILGSYGSAFHFQMYTDPANLRGNTHVTMPENSANLREGYTVRVEGTFQEVKTTTSQAGTDLKIPWVDANSVEVISPQLTPTGATTATPTAAGTPATTSDMTSTPAPASSTPEITTATPTSGDSSPTPTASPTVPPATSTPAGSLATSTPVAALAPWPTDTATPYAASSPTATTTPYATPSPMATPSPAQTTAPTATPTATAAPAPTDTPIQVRTATPTATPPPQPSPTATPQPQPSPTPTIPVPAVTLFVGNTGGDGVYIRRTPAMADKIKAWPDGTPMQIVGPDIQAEGRTWKNVRDPDGNVGWVPAEYLGSPAPAPAPVVPAPPSQPPAPQPPSNPGGQTTLSVGNTGGDGVYIRRTPAMADKIKAWPDGTPMQIVGPDAQAEGRTWKNVRDPDGNVGWVPAEYLH